MPQSPHNEAETTGHQSKHESDEVFPERQLFSGIHENDNSFLDHGLGPTNTTEDDFYNTYFDFQQYNADASDLANQSMIDPQLEAQLWNVPQQSAAATDVLAHGGNVFGYNVNQQVCVIHQALRASIPE